jgi:hypothetical protein
MQKVIGVAIGAGLLGAIQVFWDQSGGFNAQTREPAQSMPDGNEEPSLARWAKPELWFSSEPVTVIVNLPPARAPFQAPLRTTHEFADHVSLTRALQNELRRVGCYNGHINGDWTGSTRSAMKAFTYYVNAMLPVDKPDMVLLALILGHEGKACRESCPTGQGLKDGHCIPSALIALGKKPEKVVPLIAQISSRPTPAVALAELNTESKPVSVTPQPVSSARQHRNATGRPPDPRRVRSFGPSIFTQLTRSSQ